MKLALKVLSKTMDSTTLTPDKLDFATLTVAADGEGVKFAHMQTDALQTLLDNTDLSKDEDDAD